LEFIPGSAVEKTKIEISNGTIWTAIVLLRNKRSNIYIKKVKSA
jgi:hypothetical protein